MRHDISVYRRDDIDENFFIISTILIIFALIFGIWGFVALIDPLTANSYGFSAIGVLPAIIHFVLLFTHVTSGLGKKAQRDLATAYHNMPRQMKKEMPLTRKDIKGLTASRANVLSSKMDQAMGGYNDYKNHNLIRAHDYLDVVIETAKDYRELH